MARALVTRIILPALGGGILGALAVLAFVALRALAASL